MKPETARNILIGGGVRSGKSRFAVKHALALGERKAFVATAKVYDEEMARRICRHREEREGAFHTVEEPIRLVETLQSLSDYEVVVVDCLTLWVSNLLLEGENTENILHRVDGLTEVLRQRRRHVLLVTNEVGMSVHPPTPLGRQFQEVMGWAHQRISGIADEIYLAVLGNILKIHPSPLTVR